MEAIYFFSNSKGLYLCSVFGYPKALLSMCDVEKDRNEIEKIMHATTAKRATEWLEWFRRGEHGDMDPSIKDQLDDLMVVEFKMNRFVPSR